MLPSSSRRASLDYKAKRFVRAAHLPPLERHHGWKEIFSAEARAELSASHLGSDPMSGSRLDPVDLLRARFAETEGAELLTRLQDVDLGTYLVDDLLVKTDRASMAHSLEARVPYLDPVVAGLALALPTRLKVRGFRKKLLLRKAAAPLLPRRIVYGRKRGFSIPAAAWLRGELEPFARDVLAPDTLRRQGFLRPEPVTRLIDRHVAGEEDLSRQLWGLLAFTLWHEHHVERTPGPLREPRLAEAVA
jgi:asparagine synthase (glutamine-hydrolysing)